MGDTLRQVHRHLAAGDNPLGASPSADEVDCDVLIVTHNSASDLPGLFQSLTSAAEGLALRIVVVDNRSTDGTPELASVLGATIVVCPQRNLGYAGGINEGRRAATEAGSSRARLILNPDLTLAPRAIEALLAAVEHPGVGAAVPRLTDAHGDTLLSQRREPTLSRAIGEALMGSHIPHRPHWLSEEVRWARAYERQVAVDWATGAAMMVRSDVDNAVGDWDESFFMYSEEVDYCRRTRQAGYRIMYTPQAVATHREGGSGRSPALVAVLALSRVRAYSMAHGRYASAVYRLVVAAGECARAHSPGRLHAAAVVLGISSPPSFPEAPELGAVAW